MLLLALLKHRVAKPVSSRFEWEPTRERCAISAADSCRPFIKGGLFQCSVTFYVRPL